MVIRWVLIERKMNVWSVKKAHIMTKISKLVKGAVICVKNVTTKILA